MADKIVGKIPDFTSDEGVQEESVEVKQEAIGEVAPEEKVTPAEPPAVSEESEEKPTEEAKAPLSDDTGVPEEVLNKAVSRATEGLRHEVVELRRELAVARGTDRKVIQGKIENVQDKID